MKKLKRNKAKMIRISGTKLQNTMDGLIEKFWEAKQIPGDGTKVNQDHTQNKGNKLQNENEQIKIYMIKYQASFRENRSDQIFSL